jgi:hypothetical protein
MKLLLPLLTFLALAACSSLTGYTQYGDGVSSGKAVDAQTVLADPVPYTHQDSVRVKGTIYQTCKKAGCWIRVGDARHNILVRTKDHAFFVPTDSDGREVIVEGRLMAAEQTVAMRKHLLEDAGKFEEAALVTEPERGYELVAAGIAIRN